MFNGEIRNVESFIDRLKMFFDTHQMYYQTEPKATLFFIEDYLHRTDKSGTGWKKYSNKG